MPFIIGFKKIKYFAADRIEAYGKIKETLVCDLGMKRRLCADCVYDTVSQLYYAPDGVGYQNAESHFKEINRIIYE